MQPKVTGIVSSQARGTNTGRLGHGLFPHTREGDFLSPNDRALPLSRGIPRIVRDHAVSHASRTACTVPGGFSIASASRGLPLRRGLTFASLGELAPASSAGYGPRGANGEALMGDSLRPASDSVNTVYKIALSSKMVIRNEAAAGIVHPEKEDR